MNVWDVPDLHHLGAILPDTWRGTRFDVWARDGIFYYSQDFYDFTRDSYEFMFWPDDFGSTESSLDLICVLTASAAPGGDIEALIVNILNYQADIASTT